MAWLREEEGEGRAFPSLAHCQSPLPWPLEVRQESSELEGVNFCGLELLFQVTVALPLAALPTLCPGIGFSPISKSVCMVRGRRKELCFRLENPRELWLL